MTQGYRNNNPGNLRAGGFSYNGEGAPLNGFRTFSSLAYGIRAWIMNLMHKKNVNGAITYRQYLQQYAPVADGNSSQYPARVAGNDFNLDDTISTDYDSLRTLFFNQAANEIAPDDALITDADFAAGYNLYQGSIGGITYSIANTLPGNYFAVGILVLVIASLFTLFITANTK